MTAISPTIHRIDAEPVAYPTATSDLSQINEPYENSYEKDEIPEEGSFAELLAGLLRNTEKTSEAAINETKTNFPEGEFGAFVKQKESDFAEKISDLTNLPKTKISIEETDVFAGAQKMFPNLETYAQDAADGVFYQELSNLIRADLAPEAELDSDFFNVNIKDEFANKDLPQSAVQNVMFEQGVQTEAAKSAAVEAEAAIKKDRMQKNAQAASVIGENVDALVKDSKRAEEAILRVRPENEKAGKLDEMRSSQRNRRDRIAVEINDMRTNTSESANSSRSFAAVETSTGRINGEPAVREVTLELRLPEQNHALNQANTSWEAKSTSALENLLARELHQNFNGDIVRHASMALRDGGEGTIKIALKPESLGNVKIALELSDNKITGNILVESEEALNAFRKEVASLEQAFRDSGFTAADLNLSLESNGQNAEEWDNPPFVPVEIASRYEDNSERVVTVLIGQRKSSINLLA